MLLTILKQILIILAGIAVVLVAIVLLASRVSYENRRAQRFWSGAPFWVQLAYLGLIILIVAVVWVVHGIYRDWYYEEAPMAYASAEAAAADGCVVVQGSGELLAGKENWEEFLRQKETGTAAVSLAVYNGGRVQVVHQLYFDGYLCYYTRGTPYLRQKGGTETYPFLLQLSYDAPERDADRYTQRSLWVLTDKYDLTGEEWAGRSYGMEYDYTAVVLFTETQWLP